MEKTRSAASIVAWARGVAVAALGVCVCLCTSCGSDATTQGFDAPRAPVGAASELHAGVPTGERLGVSTAPAASAQSTGLAWTLPPGWTELAPTSMRAANFRIGGDARAECYLTLLAGDGGGLAANINRWRTQMGLGAVSAEDLAAAKRVSFFSGEAVFVELSGTFTGMGGGKPAENQRLLGLVLVEPQGAAFLKFTGPEDIVGRQVDAFLALAGSFRTRS